MPGNLKLLSKTAFSGPYRRIVKVFFIICFGISGFLVRSVFRRHFTFSTTGGFQVPSRMAWSGQ